MNALLVQALDDALSTAHTSIAQHLQGVLKRGTLVFGEVTEYVYFATTAVGVDFNAGNEFDIECSCYLRGLFDTIGAVMVGQRQHSQAYIPGLVEHLTR